MSFAPLTGAVSASTPDTQAQLTVLAGGVPPLAGETQVEVVLEQLDPAALPDLPGGLEAEGNAYRVRMSYLDSGSPVRDFTGQAVLSISAPALPTSVLRLGDGRWVPAEAAPLEECARVGSLVRLRSPGTFLQVYDPSTAPAVQPVAEGQPRPTTTTGQMTTAGVALAAVLALAGVVLLLRRRSRA